MKLEFLQKQIRDAAQNLHKEYRDYPLVFLNEKDVRCALYARLKSQLRRPYRVPTYEFGPTKKHARVPVFTCAVHAELHLWDEEREFVDLCIIDKDRVKFWVNPKKWDPYKTGKFRVKQYQWSKRDIIGIEIKMNWWVSSAGGDKFRELAAKAVKDIKKLRGYRRGWFVLVDHESLFKTQEEWRAFIRLALKRVSKTGWPKRSLNALYLRPNTAKAWLFKPYWK